MSQCQHGVSVSQLYVTGGVIYVTGGAIARAHVHTVKHVLTTDLFDFIDRTNTVHHCCVCVKSFNWEYVDLVRVQG